MEDDRDFGFKALVIAISGLVKTCETPEEAANKIDEIRKKALGIK